MPVTVPAHQAVAVVKLRWPRGFDGVALVVGSVSPDLAYAFIPWIEIPSHTPAALLYWCLPVTLAVSWLLRRFALRGAAYLPDLGVLRIRDYAGCAQVRHRWWVTLSSALLGAASHILWDFFTHDTGAPRLWPGMAEEAVAGLPWYQLAQYASGVVGTLAVAAMAVAVGSRRLLPRWHGRPPADPPVPPHARMWWAVVLGVAAAALVPALLLPWLGGLHILAARLLWAALIATSIAGAVVAARSEGRFTSRLT